MSIKYTNLKLPPMSRERYLEIAKGIANFYGISLKQYLRIKS